MTFEEELKKCIDEFYQNFLNKFDFKRDEIITGGMGALYSFKNDYLKIRFVNDRGIIGTEISSLYKDDFYDLAFIYPYFELLNSEIEVKGIAREKILHKQLSHIERNEFLTNNFVRLAGAFNKERYNKTLVELNKLAREINKRFFE